MCRVFIFKAFMALFRFVPQRLSLEREETAPGRVTGTVYVYYCRTYEKAVSGGYSIR